MWGGNLQRDAALAGAQTQPETLERTVAYFFQYFKVLRCRLSL